MMSSNNYGVLLRAEIKEDIDLLVEEIVRNGYTILSSGFTEKEISSIATSFENYRSAYLKDHGLEFLEQINEQHMLRAPIVNGDNLFQEVAFHPKLMRLISRLIKGDFYLNQQNGVINPGSTEYSQGRWHRDLPYQHWTSSSPLAINALYCVDDFTSENGATKVIPGSHKFAEFPSDSFVETHAIQVDAKAGDFIVLDCMIYHSGAHNFTKEERRGLNHVYSIPLLAPQISLPDAMDYSSLSPERRKLIGFGYPIPRSVDEYLRKPR